VQFDRVHIGVAVAVEDGLITPTVHDADKKSLSAIAQEVRELAGKARDKKLKPNEYGGSTFSISNLGMYGIEQFQAIINPPEAAILACGAVEQVPVVKGGQIVVGTQMKITLSCDHRALDGAVGAEFLQVVKKLLENPVLLMV
jgi:pyruvate dehydrogenase E2 component (dihydrolipoamide acetyltransferase)